MEKPVRSALVSVYHKEGLDALVQLLHSQGVTIYSTGGTAQFIADLGIPVVRVETLTGYPSILGGRVKTLHPKVFGGILGRQHMASDMAEMAQYDIPALDMVVVDLYPFEQTVASGASEAEIIEQVDIGGIALLRAAAKNFHDVLVVSSRRQYEEVVRMLGSQQGQTSEWQRRQYAVAAFDETSHYDSAIFRHFNGQLPEDQQIGSFKASYQQGRTLRYGENPHQQGQFFGDLEAMLEQISGKELSYNNLVDIDAAVALMEEFPAEEAPAFAILKHTNACGAATAESTVDAYRKALAADPVSAFGGVLISNAEVDLAAAEAMHELFFEVLIAPSYTEDALALLTKKKKRVLLKQKTWDLQPRQSKTLLNGMIVQDRDVAIAPAEAWKTATHRAPTAQEQASLQFANKLVKHTKSNTIVLATDGQLLASGTGQTSRVDALRQAIHKAQQFGFELSNAVMASDAFFPFPDCVQIAYEAGIKAVIQPGGSIKDQDSVAYCDAHDMTMVITGIRHFKH